MMLRGASARSRHAPGQRLRSARVLAALFRHLPETGDHSATCRWHAGASLVSPV